MQLASTKQNCEPSADYKWSIFRYKDEFASLTEVRRQKISGFIFLSINVNDLKRKTDAETSVFLRLEKDIELLGSMYTFKNPPEVRKFLWTHKYIIDTLFEAYKQVKRVFGENITGAYLEYNRNQKEDFERLFIILKTNLSPEESFNLLDRFDAEWWQRVDEDLKGIVEVMVSPEGFEDLLTQEEKIRKLKAVEKYFGMLSDLTPQQWEQFTEATKRRPFFEKRGRDDQ